MNKIYSMIGLATRAGAAASGEFSTEKAVKDGKAVLVIVAEDASENTRKHFFDMCRYRKIPVYVYGSREELGHAMGKEMRASLAVTEKGLGESIRKLLQVEESENGGSEHGENKSI